MRQFSPGNNISFSIFLSISLSIYLSIHLSICLSFFPPFYLSFSLCIYPSTYRKKLASFGCHLKSSLFQFSPLIMGGGAEPRVERTRCGGRGEGRCPRSFALVISWESRGKRLGGNRTRERVMRVCPNNHWAICLDGQFCRGGFARPASLSFPGPLGNRGLFFVKKCHFLVLATFVV